MLGHEEAVIPSLPVSVQESGKGCVIKEGNFQKKQL
jgi:hypothetical protein